MVKGNLFMAAWNDSGCLISVTNLFWDCVPDDDGLGVKLIDYRIYARGKKTVP